MSVIIYNFIINIIIFFQDCQVITIFRWFLSAYLVIFGNGRYGSSYIVYDTFLSPLFTSYILVFFIDDEVFKWSGVISLYFNALVHVMTIGNIGESIEENVGITVVKFKIVFINISRTFRVQYWFICYNVSITFIAWRWNRGIWKLTLFWMTIWSNFIVEVLIYSIDCFWLLLILCSLNKKS